MVTIIFNLNIQGLNKSNRYSHWGKQAAAKKKQRALSCVKVANEMALGNLQKCSSYEVTFLRSGVRLLDDDNFIGGCKHIRDGIADALGIDDGSNKLRFIYLQTKGQRKFLQVNICEKN